MAAANVNVPDILDKAVYAMEEEDVEEDEGTNNEEDEEDDEEEDDEDEDAEDNKEDEEAEDDAEEDRDLLMYSLTVFGYNANTCKAIVAGLNLRVPMDLVSFSDTRVDILAAALLWPHVYRANARIKLPLQSGTTCTSTRCGRPSEFGKAGRSRPISLTRPRSLEPELASMSCA
jgi:hypothetical protein